MIHEEMKTKNLVVRALGLMVVCAIGGVGAALSQEPNGRGVSSHPLVTRAEYERWQTELSNWGRWGKDDELGTLNLITPAKRKQALAELSALMQGGRAEVAKQSAAAASAAPAEPTLDRLRESIRNHLRRSRELTGQGKWAEAGKELDAIEAEVRK